MRFSSGVFRGRPKPLATARRFRPRLQRAGRQIEVIAGSRIAMATHAPDHIQAQLIDVQRLRIDQLIATCVVNTSPKMISRD
jgi:hypothetical protein